MKAISLAQYQTCGVGIWYDFYSDYWSTEKNFGGLGFAIASFIEDENCKKTYDYINKNHTIVYQSPVKKNKYSGNDCFFIVFSKGKK